MANIDYQGARKEIVQIFENAGSERKVVFWYDAPAIFKEDLINDNYECCKVLVCDKNEFSIKKTIEHDDPSSNYLIYIPFEKPEDTNNWLLDLLLYGEEYYADTVALTMRRLNLTNTDLRRVIDRHSKFFDAEARTKKLSSYIEINDSMKPEDLSMAMMCVLSKSSGRSIESILTELMIDDQSGSKYSDIVKYGLEDFLWDELCRYYNYEGDLKIETLAKKFMFTALLDQAPELDNLPSFYDQYTITSAGKMDAKYFVNSIKGDKRYPRFQEAMTSELKIEGILSARDIISVQYADVFECVDAFIIQKIASSLLSGSLDYDAFDRVITNRMNSMWYEKHHSEYEVLSSAIDLFRRLDIPIAKELLATEYIKKYTEDYYKVDTNYRNVCSAYKKIEAPIDEIEQLISKLDKDYQYKFLDPLGKEFSDSIKDVDRWSFPGITMSKDFYQKVQRNNYKKCFVIISDGFRYEIGHELYEKIRIDKVLNGSEKIEYAISPLPSETRFGMASLLPHRILEYIDKNVKVDEMSTNGFDARDAILKKKNASYAGISYEKISQMTRDELRSYMADKSLVYIYHNVVDNAGEHNESKVFDVVESAVDEIVSLIRKLYNNLQISNYYITADHGFLYRRKPVEESQKYSDILSLNSLECSRRFVLTDDESLTIPYTMDFVLGDVSNGNYRLITPYGYDVFKTSGGLQYVHGGPSLQEIIVPIVHISELRAANSKETVAPVGVRLKSIMRKITNRSFNLEFEQVEKVEDKKQPVTCETYIEDEAGNKVSNVYKFLAASESDDLEQRVTRVRFNLMNIDFDRNKRYYLILKDADNSDEYIAREQFTIDILPFKMF